MTKIAIASGKGGTGKTSVSVSFFNYLLHNYKGKVQLVDCDVEEPNDLLFYPNAKNIKNESINKMVPQIDNNQCCFCRKCAEYCEFNAIVVIPSVSFAEVNTSLCHSCAACMFACEHNAIKESEEFIGTVNHYQFDKATIVEGKLKVGSAMQTVLIKQTKKRILPDADIVILDAPPGTSCPVVETICDADFIVLVAEPTLFGLYDLKLMVELLKDIKKPYSVVINKAGLGDDKIYQFLQKNKIELIGEIPYSTGFAIKYAQGKMNNDFPKEVENAYQTIFKKIIQKTKEVV